MGGLWLGGGGGGGGASTIADGADINAGATTDVGVTGNVAGTISAKLRGIGTILANVWDSANGKLKVSETIPTGAATDALQTAGNASLASIDTKLTNPVPVSGAFYQATQPVSMLTGCVA